MKTDLFNDTKYTRWYWAIIEKRVATPAPKTAYRERHHIIPASFFIVNDRDTPGWLPGNADAKSNLVWMTAREHALCHWLLKKMTTHNTRAYELMVYAFNMMWVKGDHQQREMTRMITRAYERNREEWSRLHSAKMTGREPWNKGKKLDGEKYKKAGRSNKGRALSPEVAEAKRLRQLGRKQSEETKERRRQSMTGFVRGPMSDDEKMKRSVATKGVPKNHGAKVAAANVGVVSINKDGKEKKVKRELLDTWLNDGWALGGRPRVTQQGKKRGPYKKKLEA